MIGALQRAGRPAARLSRATSTVAAEFAASTASIDRMLEDDLAAFTEEAAREAATQEAAAVLSGGSDASAVLGTAIVPEELKPHHAGYAEAQAQANGGPEAGKASYDGLRVRQYYGQDPSMFTADPPLPGGTLDLEAAAKHAGLSVDDMLGNVFSLKDVTRAQPRLVADFERYTQGDALVNKEQAQAAQQLVDDALSSGDFWAGMLEGEGVEADLAAALAEAHKLGDDTRLNIDLASLPADVAAAPPTPAQVASLRRLLLPLVTEASKVDETAQRLLAQTPFPAVSGEWRLPATAGAGEGSEEAAGSGPEPTPAPSTAAAGEEEEGGVDLEGAVSLADAIEEVDAGAWGRDPNFRPPITDPSDPEYMSDADDQEDNWPLFRDAKTEHLRRNLTESGASGATGDLDDVLVAADFIPGGAELAAEEAARPPHAGRLSHSRAYKPHHFRMLQAYRRRDLPSVFALWDHTRQQSSVPDYVATHIALDAAASAGATDLVAVITDDVISRQGQFTPATLKLVLKAAGVSGNLDAAEAAFAAMEGSPDLAQWLDIHCYTPVMAAAMAEGNVSRAFHWFNRLRAARIKPSDTAFHILVAGAAGADSHAPLHFLWRAMRLHTVVAISAPTWHALIDGFTSAPTPDAEVLWDVFSAMSHPRWFGGPTLPDAQRMCDIFNVLVEGGLFDGARRLEHAMEAGGMFEDGRITRSDIADIVASFPPPGTPPPTPHGKWEAEGALYGSPYLPEDIEGTEARLQAAKAQVSGVGSMARLGGEGVADYPWEREAAAEGR